MPLFLPSLAVLHPIVEGTYTFTEHHPLMLSWGRGHCPSCCGRSVCLCTSSLQDIQHAAWKAQPKPTPGMKLVFPPETFTHSKWGLDRNSH